MSYIKVSQLPGTANITDDDKIMVVDNPTGSPVSKAITFGLLLDNIVANSGFTADLAANSGFLYNLSNSFIGSSGLAIVYDNDTNKIDFTITEVDGGNL